MINTLICRDPSRSKAWQSDTYAKLTPTKSNKTNPAFNKRRALPFIFQFALLYYREVKLPYKVFRSLSASCSRQLTGDFAEFYIFQFHINLRSKVLDHTATIAKCDVVPVGKYLEWTRKQAKTFYCFLFCFFPSPIGSC